MKLNLRKVMAFGAAALIGLGASAQTLTQDWAITTGVPGSAGGGDLRFATAYDGKVYVPNKAENKIYAFDENGIPTEAAYDLSSFFTTEGIADQWTAITSDDAGNILINYGGNSACSNSWVIVSADGQTIQKLDLVLEGLDSPVRVDQVGRIVGNVLSDEGGYMIICPNTMASQNVVKIVNGEQVIEDEDGNVFSMTVSLGVTAGTGTLGAFRYNTVAEIDEIAINEADLTSTVFVHGARNSSTIASSTGDITFTDRGASANDGFDVFTLQGKTYAVIPGPHADITTTTHKSSLSLYVIDMETGATVAKYDDPTPFYYMGSVIARPVDENSVAIYRWAPSAQVAKFTFSVATEEPAAPLYMVGHNNEWDPANPTEIPATETAGVYSLSAVEFTNPNKAFKISENKGTWDEFNAKAMCADGDAVVQINTPTKLYLYAGTDITYAENGTYDVTVDLSGEVKTITLKKTVGVEDIEAVETVAPVYYNLQGVEVANPSNGLYIVKRGNKVAKEVVVK